MHPQSWQLTLKAGIAPAKEAISAYEWRVEQIDGSFVYRVEYKEKVSGVEDMTVEVPETGAYRITLTLWQENDRLQTYEHLYHLRDLLIVAIGDSYFCGEGNPDVPGKPSSAMGPIACNLATLTKFLVEKTAVTVPMEREAEWQEKRVHRSYQSGPSLAAADLELPSLGIVTTFLNFARSGSSIDQGLLAPLPSDTWTEIGQLQETKETIGDRPIDALLISTGGNDIEFPKRLIDLIREDLLMVGAGDGVLGDEELNRRQEVAEAKEQIEALPEKMERLATAVHELNARRVYLMEYPMAHFDSVNEAGEVVVSSGCGIFDGPDMEIDGKDAQVIKQSGEKLNRTLRQTAEKHGWLFVEGIAEAFAGHGRCSPEPYFISAEESCQTQGDFEGTMHPNRKGHRAYAQCIQKALYAYTVAPRLAKSEKT